MFVKRLLQKATAGHHSPHQQQHHRQNNRSDNLSSSDLDPRVIVHHGIPYTASILAFDPIQRLLAIGTLDGRIKVIGGDNIEGLLISPKQLPYKYLEFLQNQGMLVCISNDNDIQLWNLENRSLAFSLQWESNITAFSVVRGSHFMYIGDEYGMVFVLKYMVEDEKLLQLPYYISAKTLTDAAGVSVSNHQPIVGILPQPCSSGNRVLIALVNGLIILWDVVEAWSVIARGGNVLQLKDGNIDPSDAANNSLMTDISEFNSVEKEISSLCWASYDGSVLAVGYIDGDILFWKMSTASTKGQRAELSYNTVVKLQLSSAEKKLPVIVLHWCRSYNSHGQADGKLFIYGGDEIGSEEVITVLSLEWSSRMETLRCIGRMEVKLTGSFADMILLPDFVPSENKQVPTVCVLTSPGQLGVIESASLTDSESQQEMKKSISTIELPSVIPVVPVMTVAKLFLWPVGEKLPATMSEMFKKLSMASNLSGNIKLPLTGGILYHSIEDQGIERLYIAGYDDGSVRIWDATHAVLSLLCVLEGKLINTKVDGLRSPVTKVEFCFFTLNLAIGNEYGLVCLYNLDGRLDDTNFHLVGDSKHEVSDFHQVQGLNCRAVFDLLNSPVKALEFMKDGSKLVVGYQCGNVAVVDTSKYSASFLVQAVTSPCSPLISVIQKAFKHNGDNYSTKASELRDTDNHMKELIFVLTKDAKVFSFDAHTGKMVTSKPMHLKESIAISMYVIDCNMMEYGPCDEKQPQKTEEVDMIGNVPSEGAPIRIHLDENEDQISTESGHSLGKFKNSLVLLCCKDALRVYPVRSVILGNKKSICKIKLTMPCAWTSTFLKDGKVSGLVLLYETGAMEIRSMPDLELIMETSLMSMLRWNFKTNMVRAIGSTNNGHITLACGSEVAFVSLLASENDFRIPECLPCLHDKVLAAAAEAAFSIVSKEMKKSADPGILGGIVKSLKGGKVNHHMKFPALSNYDFGHLEDVFSRNPFPDTSSSTTNVQEDNDLDIDDIEIDEPSPMESTLYTKEQKNKSEREKLFDGESADTKPRVRTREEIIAKYRKAGDASSAAGEARNKLLERQEKLERINRRTEDMRNEAEDFASLANELVKAMEKQKWWHI